MRLDHGLWISAPIHWSRALLDHQAGPAGGARDPRCAAEADPVTPAPIAGSVAGARRYAGYALGFTGLALLAWAIRRWLQD